MISGHEEGLIEFKEGSGQMTLTNPISCHLITWGADTNRGMAEAKELGYGAVEFLLGQAMQYTYRVGQFRELLASRGFRLSALYCGGRFADPDSRRIVVEENLKVARFLAALGVDRIVFGPTGPRNPEGTSVEELKVAAATIDEAAKACFDVGVVACVHPHLWTEIQDRTELDAIMDLTNPDYVFLAPDTAHLTGAGMDVPDVLRTYASRVGYMHLKDLSPEDAAGDVEKFPILTGTEALPIFCELGLGTIDFAPILDAIREIGYTGWLTVEIDQSTSTPIQSLRQCRDWAVRNLGSTFEPTLVA
jgi:inosose dehydratase